jgi:hypothetical protein
MNDSSGIIGKLDRTAAEHVGHLSMTLVFSRNVAHQKQVSHSMKIEAVFEGLGNVQFYWKVVNYILFCSVGWKA